MPWLHRGPARTRKKVLGNRACVTETTSPTREHVTGAERKPITKLDQQGHAVAITAIVVVAVCVVIVVVVAVAIRKSDTEDQNSKNHESYENENLK